MSTAAGTGQPGTRGSTGTTGSTGETGGRPGGPATADGAGQQGGTSTSPGRLVAYWLVVGIPLAYGVVSTVQKAAALFTG